MTEKSLTFAILAFVASLIIDYVLMGFLAALHNINVAEINKKAEEEDEKANSLLLLMHQEQRIKYTAYMVMTACNMFTGMYVVKYVASFYGKQWYVELITALVLLLIIAVIGIVVPIKAAIQKPEKMAYQLKTVMVLIKNILIPVMLLVDIVANIILRLFGMKPSDDTDNVTEEEILTMVNEGHEQGVIEADEAEMISNIFEFGDKEAMDIMTHRKNIVALDGNLTLEEAVSFMLHENNSRYPVYEEDIDNIIGMIHIKDALKEYGNVAKVNQPIKEIEEVMYEATLIPGTRNINDLFKFMQKEKVHMVIVVDEYGQTAGLVTMEDILEEIVGNILDEHDEEEEQIKKKADDTYVVDGLTLLEDLEEELEIEFELEEDILTLNGFMIMKIGKIPMSEHEGLMITYKNYEFKIISVEKKIFRTVSITKLKEEIQE